MKSISHVISTIFQPLLMPTYGVLLLFVYTYFGLMYQNHFWQIITPVVVFSFVIPSILIFLLYRMKIISDLSLKIRRERIYPYLITVVSYSAMIVFYNRMYMPGWFLMMLAASVAIMIFAIIITLKWKISAHMFGIGGLIGGAMSISYFVERSNPYYMFMGLFIIAGLVGTSRLILRRHTLSQVIAGFLLGFLVSFTFVWFGVKI
ncbi:MULTISPECIES: phosphatase PAP2 family protein [Proteiniphilum]|uniref:phosphatase PAP2 family protein n=1 Tax=Proteiniphilum TaxID=294702 RepID=UPI001EEBDF6C|nr:MULTISPECIES: phosphatase PAP2 family protein [Proteiniphilum]ULB34046.1 phosphatase PAP2 family protein [Proteiniphilum propionicum]